MEVCGAGISIGAGVAMYSTAFAMSWANASMMCTPTVNGLISTARGDGGRVWASVIATDVVADAGEQTPDPSPMARTATAAVTAAPADRINRDTGESCRKNRPAHSRIAERAPTQARCARRHLVMTGAEMVRPPAKRLPDPLIQRNVLDAPRPTAAGHGQTFGQ